MEGGRYPGRHVAGLGQDVTAPSRFRRSSARIVLGITVGASLLAVAGAASDRAHAAENVPSAIVVVDKRGVVGLMRPDGTGFHRIGKSTPETEAPIDRPMLSPDGRKLLFFGGEGSLVITGTDLSDPVAIAGDAGADRVYDAAWSPTGRQVAIESRQGAGAVRIELVGIDGSDR